MKLCSLLFKSRSGVLETTGLSHIEPTISVKKLVAQGSFSLREAGTSGEKRQ
jgi:hypothetical protein